MLDCLSKHESVPHSISDLFCADWVLSKKIKSVIEANAKSGKYRATFAPYGYVKGNCEKKLPVVDEPAASVFCLFTLAYRSFNFSAFIPYFLRNDRLMSIFNNYPFRRVFLYCFVIFIGNRCSSHLSQNRICRSSQRIDVLR